MYQYFFVLIGLDFECEFIVLNLMGRQCDFPKPWMRNKLSQ